MGGRKFFSFVVFFLSIFCTPAFAKILSTEEYQRGLDRVHEVLRTNNSGCIDNVRLLFRFYKKNIDSNIVTALSGRQISSFGFAETDHQLDALADSIWAQYKKSIDFPLPNFSQFLALNKLLLKLRALLMADPEIDILSIYKIFDLDTSQFETSGKRVKIVHPQYLFTIELIDERSPIYGWFIRQKAKGLFQKRFWLDPGQIFLKNFLKEGEKLNRNSRVRTLLHEILHAFQAQYTLWGKFTDVLMSFKQLNRWDRFKLWPMDIAMRLSSRSRAEVFLKEFQAFCFQDNEIAELWDRLVLELLKPNPDRVIMKEILIQAQSKLDESYGLNGISVIEAALNWLDELKAI